MSLKARILLSVTLLFILCIAGIFVTTGLEFNHVITKGEKELDQKITNIDEELDVLVRSYLGEKFTNMAQQLNYVFKQIENVPKWKEAFLPNKYNIKTKNWATASTLLKEYPWMQLINVTINNNNSAFIYFTAPYLRKFAQVNVTKDLTVFITNINGNLQYVIGVPFWSTKIKEQKSDILNTPDFVFFNSPSKWLFYSLKQILAIDPSKLTVRQDKDYKMVDLAIGSSLQQRKEFDFIINNLRNEIIKIKKIIKNNPNLLVQFNDQAFLRKLVQQKMTPDNLSNKTSENSCNLKLCHFHLQEKEKKWFVYDDFSHRSLLRNMTWEFCMLNRTGAWNFSPFNKNAPLGFVSSTSIYDTDHKKNITEGIFISDITVKKPIDIQSDCDFRTYSPEFDKKAIYKNQSPGLITSCKNKKLNILYTKEIQEPFLTSSGFIKIYDKDKQTVNETEITLGVSVDDLIRSTALISGDMLFVSKNKNIRFYSYKGKVVNIDNTEDKYREAILQNESGTLKLPNGNLYDFRRLGTITDSDGYIVFLENIASPSQISKSLITVINSKLRKISLQALIISIICLIIITFLLLKVISKITKPINELAEITKHVGEGNLEKIHFKKENLNKKDEVGKLYNSFSEMIDTMKEGQKVKGLLDKVVSKEIASKILKEGINLSGETKNLTIMFCDIRKFTSISENMDPKDVLHMLNECLALLSSVIEKHEGVIDSFEGDRIMTLFGAPIETKDHVQKAVLCAIEMQEAMSIWNHERQISGFCKLEIGIGIHTGEAVAGNVGTEKHLSYSVIGHIVNLTSRLCDSAKANEIIVTEEIIKNSQGVNVEEKEPQKFKGLSKELITYKISNKK